MPTKNTATQNLQPTNQESWTPQPDRVQIPNRLHLNIESDCFQQTFLCSSGVSVSDSQNIHCAD